MVILFNNFFVVVFFRIFCEKILFFSLFFKKVVFILLQTLFPSSIFSEMLHSLLLLALLFGFVPFSSPKPSSHKNQTQLVVTSMRQLTRTIGSGSSQHLAPQNSQVLLKSNYAFNCTYASQEIDSLTQPVLTDDPICVSVRQMLWIYDWSGDLSGFSPSTSLSTLDGLGRRSILKFAGSGGGTLKINNVIFANGRGLKGGLISIQNVDELIVVECVFLGFESTEKGMGGGSIWVSAKGGNLISISGSLFSNHFEDEDAVYNQNTAVVVEVFGCPGGANNSISTKGHELDIRGPHSNNPHSYCCGGDSYEEHFEFCKSRLNHSIIPTILEIESGGGRHVGSVANNVWQLAISAFAIALII